MKIKNIDNALYTYCDYIQITNNGIFIQSYDRRNSEYNKFEDIKKFEVIINVGVQYYKGNEYSKLENILIKFVTKKMNISHTIESRGSWGIIYQLLDYKKYFPKFVMKVNGSSDGIDIPIKVYSKFGKKLLVKNPDSFIQLNFFAAILLGFPLYMIINAFMENQLANFSDYHLMLPYILISLTLVTPIVYQEFQKYQIRKILGL